MTEMERMARMLEKTFNKQPWYGSSIMDILKEVKPEHADQRLNQTHTIAELVLHMVAWRRFTIERLSGNMSYEVTDKLNFPRPESWMKCLAELEESQKQLTEAVRKFPENRLGEIVPSKVHKYTYYTLLHGIIQHDIYHLGQIALLKKAFAS